MRLGDGAEPLGQETLLCNRTKEYARLSLLVHSPEAAHRAKFPKELAPQHSPCYGWPVRLLSVVL